MSTINQQPVVFYNIYIPELLADHVIKDLHDEGEDLYFPNRVNLKDIKKIFSYIGNSLITTLW